MPRHPRRQPSIATLVACGAFLALACACQQASAGVMSSLNQADFVLTPESFPITTTTTTANSEGFTAADMVSNSGLMTLENAGGIGAPKTGTHAYRGWSDSILTGPVYVMNGDENFNISFSTPQTAFAFDYEDDSVNSEFTLEFFNGTSSLGTTTFTSTSPFNTSKFIGFYSHSPFTRVTVRENDGRSNSNEYFQFYSARVVPEPTSLTVFLLGTVLAVFPRRQRNRPPVTR